MSEKPQRCVPPFVLTECLAECLLSPVVLRYFDFFYSLDGDGEVMSRVRRGVLSLRVVRQMLS